MDEFLDFMHAFYHMTGVDLTLYKRPQMERRLTSLRNKHGFPTFPAFISELKQNAQLLYDLLDKMTINVSEFFRNMERWDALVAFLHEPSMNRPLKAWSAACSTGEEPYTLAIIMEEKVKAPYEILATDIDQNVLNQAIHGRYKEHQVRGMSREDIGRLFVHERNEYRIDERFKKHVSFKLHNLLADAYPTGLDLIICRNVMIYFTDEAKHKVTTAFARALRPGGLLFVGSTEQFIRTEQHCLTQVAPFLYRKTDC